MLPLDPAGKNGPKKPLPDNFILQEPKDESHVYPIVIASQFVTAKAAPPAVAIAV